MNPVQQQALRALIVLTVLAVLYTVHIARDVLLPITLALVFALILQPGLKFMERRNVPRPLGSLVLVTGLVAVLGGGLWILSSSALEWARRLPEARDVIASISSSVQREVEQVDQATREVAAIAREFAPGDGAEIDQVVIRESTWQGDLWLTASEVALSGGLTIVLLFFLLASSQQLIQRCVGGISDREARLRALRATADAEGQVSRYLTTVTAMNIGVGAVTGLGLWALGFPDPGLWGAIAGALRFVPFLGACTTAVLLALVAVIAFEQTWIVLAAPLGFLAFSTLLAQFVDPFVFGLRFRLNPIIVFIWILFWGWLWGVPGILLAVPLLVLFQVTCQHIDWLSPVALVVGGSVSPAVDE